MSAEEILTLPWIDTREKPLPKDGQPYFAIWKGAFCIVQFDDEDDLFHLSFFPAEHLDVMRVAKNREKKFTHWFKPTYPKDEDD